MNEKRTALYSQIKNYLCGLIAENADKKDYILPSENMLCNIFRVSRITAKRALDELEAENVIIRKKGAGSFISSDLDEEFLKQYSRVDTLKAQSAEELKKRKTISLIIPDLKSKYLLNLMRGVQTAALKFNWDILLSTTSFDQQTEANLIKKLINSVDGFIISPTNHNIYNREILRLSMHNFPLVLIDNELKGIDSSTVASDNYLSAFDAVSMLLKKGKRHIGIISQQINSVSFMDRLAGYEDAHKENHHPVYKQLIYTDLEHYDDNYKAKISGFLKANPKTDALLALNYDAGICAAKTLLNQKSKIDMKYVIFFDEEFSEIYDFLNIKFNYIEQDAFEIGFTATKIIYEKILNETIPNQKIRIPAKLHINL